MINGLQEIWEAVTKPAGQIVTSVTTFTWGATSYFNYVAWHDALSLLGMIAGICSCATLTALNVLRFFREWKRKQSGGGDEC